MHISHVLVNHFDEMSAHGVLPDDFRSVEVAKKDFSEALSAVVLHNAQHAFWKERRHEGSLAQCCRMCHDLFSGRKTEDKGRQGKTREEKRRERGRKSEEQEGRRKKEEGRRKKEEGRTSVMMDAGQYSTKIIKGHNMSQYVAKSRKDDFG